MPVYTVCPTCRTMFRVPLIWATQYPRCCIAKGMADQVKAELLESTKRGIEALNAGHFGILDELKEEMNDK